MTICFSARSSFLTASPMIFNSLKKLSQDVDAVFVVCNKDDGAKLKTRYPDLKSVEISAFIESNWDTYNEKTFKDYEEKYCDGPMWSYVYTDRFLINRPYDYVVKMVSGLFNFYENLFSNGSISFYYDEVIATLQTYIAYLVAKKHGVKYVTQMNFRMLEMEYHYISNDPFEHMTGFDSNYMEKDYPEELVARAEKYLSDFEKTQTQLKAMGLVKSLPKPTLKYSIYAHMLFTKKKYHNPYSYIDYKYYDCFFERSRFYSRYRKSRKYYKKPDYSKKFVYFPLHYQPEASTIVCAQKYEKQLYYIDSLAKSLPADTLLYVKEHYALLGHRDPAFYAQLQSYPNVRLIDPLVSSHELMKNSVAVTTLTGTAGWEAMLLGIPVILGGNIYFDNAPGIMKTDEIYLNYCRLMESWQKPEREQIVKYLCECMSNIYEGCVYFDQKQFLNEDNMDKLATSLMNYIDKTCEAF